MTTQQEPNTVKIFRVHELINDVLELAVKKYKLDPIESGYLKSTYFFQLFQLRQKQDVLYEDTLIFEFDALKDLSRKCIQIFKREHYIKIPHEYMVSNFRQKLTIQKKEKNIEFEVNNFELDLKNTRLIDDKLNLSQEIYEYTKFILDKFNAKKIPIELYIVTVYDVYLTYLENKDEIEIDKNIIYYIVTGQLDIMARRMGLNSFSQTPPSKQNFNFNMKARFSNTRFSLKLLTLYFGDSSWHQLFKRYDRDNANNYFCFNEESCYKFAEKTRQYKDVSLKTDNIQEFLGDEYRDQFFNIWEGRLKKNEKVFFNEFIKPQLLNKKEIIEFDFSNHKNIDLKTIINGIRDTSWFKYEGERSFGQISIIPSLMQRNNSLTLEINNSLYKN